MKLNAYDVAQLLLVLSVLALIVYGSLTFMNLSFVIIGMFLLLSLRVLSLESRMEEKEKGKESKAEKLMEARKWDELVARIGKLREEMTAKIGMVEAKMSSEKAVEERLAKLYEKIIGIENKVTKTTKTLASSYDVLERRLRRIETELGLATEEGEAE